MLNKDSPQPPQPLTRTFRRGKETLKCFRFIEINDNEPEVAGFLYIQKAFVPNGCDSFTVTFKPERR